MKCKICQIRNVKYRLMCVCGTCYMQAWRLQNPLQAAYTALRDNAKRRSHSFSLSFEEFSDFAIKTEYIIKKGKSKLSYTIDRIDPAKGYEVGNLQVLTNSDNVKKAHYDRTMKVVYEWETQQYWSKDITTHNHIDFSPF